RDGRQHAPARGRALRGPRRPRRGLRWLHRGVDDRIRPAHAGRDGGRRRRRAQDQRPRTLARPLMSRILFFFSEAFRALRRNGAPTLAAVITTVVTVVLLGVLIPVFQTAQAKSDEVRSELNVSFALYDDASNAEIAQAKGKIEEIPGVDEVAFVSKQEALATLKSELSDKTIVQ